MSDDEPPKRRMVRPPSGGLEAGRHKPARLKTAYKRTPSQQAWLERQINDPFSAEARAKGYRSRAAFKLSEIDDRLKLIRKGTKIVDLGCAPGGWIQIAQERGAGKVVGVDLLPVDPLGDAELVQMDFTDPACWPISGAGAPPSSCRARSASSSAWPSSGRVRRVCCWTARKTWCPSRRRARPISGGSSG